MFMILNFLGMGIGQSGEAAQTHPNLQIHPLHIASRDVRRIRIADYLGLLNATTLRRTISGLRSRWFRAIQFVQHGVVDLCAECAFDCVQIGTVAVCRQLDPVRQAARQIADELRGIHSATTSNMPARNQLRVRTNRGPSPHVTKAKLALQFFRQILFLRIAEGPDFITLEPRAWQMPQGIVLIPFARSSQIGKEF